MLVGLRNGLLLAIAAFGYVSGTQDSRADVWTFETPSQNVQCVVGEGFEGSDISCTIINRSGSPASPRPSSCKGDWGHSFEMYDRGPAKLVCSDLQDVTKGAQQVAEYGVKGEFGGFICTSSKTGLKCLNTDGNGFFLSRRKQVLYNSGKSTAKETRPWKRFDGSSNTYSAGYSSEDASFYVGCPETVAAKEGFSLTAILGGISKTAEVTLTFTDGYKAIFAIIDGTFAVENPEDGNLFNTVVKRLKSGNQFTVEQSDGQLAQIPLKGSSNAIGVCKVASENLKADQQDSTAAMPVAATDILQIAANSEKLGASARSAKGPATTRTVDNGATYHKLDSCAYEPGIAIANYHFTAQAKKPYDLEITDICFDRKSGELWGSEPEEGLELVRSVETTEFFEIIHPNSQPYERRSVTAGKYRPDGQNFRSGSVNFSYDRQSNEFYGYEPSGRQQAGDVDLHGFLYEKSSVPDGASSGFKVNISALDYLDTVRGNIEGHLGREGPYVSFDGVLIFDGTNGTAKLKDTGEGAGKGTGSLQIQVDDTGALSGTGSLRFSNARLAGVNSHDWKTANWEIIKIVGRMVGEGGHEFRAVAIAKGETVDQDGYVNPALAAVTIMGYDAEMMKLWGDDAAAAELAAQTAPPAQQDDDKQLETEAQLKQMGFDPGPVDGVFDTQTAGAINEFQKQFGLPQSIDLTAEQLVVLQSLVKARAAASTGQ